MDFSYVIVFEADGQTITRTGMGVFYPGNVGFHLEHMLWLMTEEFGRPTAIKVEMDFHKHKLLGLLDPVPAS